MTILAAVGTKAKAQKVVEVGHDLAQAHDEELVVLHVVEEDQFEAKQSQVRGMPVYDDFQYTPDEEGAERYTREIIETVLSEPDFDMITTRGRIGEPVEEILAEADELDARYIVIDGRRRSPIGKAAFGADSQQILLRANRPVVTVID